MNKLFEALEEIGNIDLGDNPYKKFEVNKLKNVYNKEFAILYNAIAELKAIKEAKPSEALNCLRKLRQECVSTYFDENNKQMWTTDKNKDYRCNTIEQALLKFQELEKVGKNK